MRVLLLMLELILLLTVAERYYAKPYNAWHDEWINDARRHDEWYGLGHDASMVTVRHTNFCHTDINRYGASQVFASTIIILMTNP